MIATRDETSFIQCRWERALENEYIGQALLTPLSLAGRRYCLSTSTSIAATGSLQEMVRPYRARHRKKRCVFCKSRDVPHRTRGPAQHSARPPTHTKFNSAVGCAATPPTSRSQPSPRPRRRRLTPFSSPCCAAHGGEPDPGDPHRTESAGRNQCASGCPSGPGS